MNLKQSALAAAVTATLALGASGQASAYVYGAAGLTIDNLTVTISPFAAASGFTFQFNQSNVVDLNSVGSPVSSSASCSGSPGPAGVTNNCTSGIPRLDAAAVNATGSAPLRANNSLTGGEFTFLGPNAFTGDFANADSQIVTAELVNIGQPTLTHNIAESLLNSGFDASGSSQIQSQTNLSLNFTIVGGPADFTLTFDADPDLLAAIFGEAGSGQAQANMTASITLTQTTGGTGFANWTPQGNGTGVNDCTFSGGVACSETADTQDLNINVGTGVNDTSDASSWDPNSLNLTSFGVTVTGLTAGNWTLVLNETKSNQLVRTEAVPEPGVLALMGIGLMGLFATSRRRKLS